MAVDKEFNVCFDGGLDFIEKAAEEFIDGLLEEWNEADHELPESPE